MRYLIFYLLPLMMWSLTVAAAPSVTDVENAIKNNDVAALEKMAADGLDVNMKDTRGNSLVYLALTNRRPSAQVLRFLADHGAYLNTPIPVTGETPLIHAVAAAERIQAAAEQVFVDELTPEERDEMSADFEKAAAKEMKHAVETVRLLVELGADVNQETPFGTPLMKASSNSWNSEIVTILLDAGADVNQEDQNGRTALFYAEANGCSDISMQLIVAGGDIYHRDINGKTYIEIDKKDLQSAEIIHDM